MVHLIHLRERGDRERERERKRQRDRQRKRKKERRRQRKEEEQKEKSQRSEDRTDSLRTGKDVSPHTSKSERGADSRSAYRPRTETGGPLSVRW